MKFSLLIAHYNNGKFFADCYHSILAQTHTDWDVVIVDDASTDDSVRVIRDMIKNDPRFMLYINDQHAGVGYTKRRCIELSESACCGFIDPDDTLLPQALSVMNDAYIQNSDAVLFHSTLYFCNEKLEQQSVYKGAAAVDTSNKQFFNLNGAVAAFVTFSKAAYDKTEGIDVYMQRAADQDLYIKMAETGSFHFINQPLYLYRRNPTGISTNNNVSKAHYWHWFAAMQGAKRRGVNLEENFINAFVAKKEFDHLQQIVNESGVYKLSKWLGPVLKWKSGK